MHGETSWRKEGRIWDVLQDRKDIQVDPRISFWQSGISQDQKDKVGLSEESKTGRIRLDCLRSLRLEG